MYFSPELLKLYIDNTKKSENGRYESISYDILKDNDIYSLGLIFIQAGSLNKPPVFHDDESYM